MVVENVGSNPTVRTNTLIAQLEEHSTTDGEVKDSNSFEGTNNIAQHNGMHSVSKTVDGQGSIPWCGAMLR